MMCHLSSRSEEIRLNYVLCHDLQNFRPPAPPRTPKLTRNPPGYLKKSRKIAKKYALKQKKRFLSCNFSQLSHHNGFATWLGSASQPAQVSAKNPPQICLKLISPEITTPGEKKQQIVLMRQEATIVKMAGFDLAIGVSRIKPLFLKNISKTGYFLTVAGVLSETPQVNILDFLQVARKLSLRMKLLLIRKLVDVVRTMHRRGVAHLNLTPNCIWVDRDGNLKLTDFEHAQTLQGYVPQPLHGNLTYVPPEHILANRIVDPRMQDEWAVSVMAFTLLFHRVPWRLADFSNRLFELYCLNNFEFWKRCFYGDIGVWDLSHLRKIFNAALSPVASRRTNLFGTKEFGQPLSGLEHASLENLFKGYFQK